jgi:hypothetical protein
MRRSDVVVAHTRRVSRSAFLAAPTICFTLAVAIGTVIAVPTASDATPVSPAAGGGSAAPLAAHLPRPLMCRPEPPDYPGCTPRQVRPLLRARFASEYTGHAYGYRYYRMGQHSRGVIFAHLPPALNAKLARLYRAAVERYKDAHRTVVVGDGGVRHVVVSYPRYRTWAGFRASSTAFCTPDNVTLHFPVRYCGAITKLGQAGAAINRLLNTTKRIAFSCDGFAIGGVASGAFRGWVMGTGALEGGYYGGAAVEIGCQTTHLWNWVTDLW